MGKSRRGEIIEDFWLCQKLACDPKQVIPSRYPSLSAFLKEEHVLELEVWPETSIVIAWGHVQV